MNHLPFTKADITGAELACITGDPFRVPWMAREMDANAKQISHTREFAVWLAHRHDQPIIFASHGIGGSSLSILVEELALLGILDILRIGTSGAIQSTLQSGDVVISTASVRLEGVTPFYAPLSYPAVSHPDWVQCLQDAARKNKVSFHSGITASTDSFYPGQQRADTKTRYIIPPWDNAMDMWKHLQVLNYEMESSTLFVLGSVLGLRTGCLTSVIVERDSDEQLCPTHEKDFQPAWNITKSALDSWLTDWKRN